MIPIKRMFTSQIGQNIFTNYLAVIWMGGLSLALIPFYLKYLGTAQWGVVAICITVQGFLGLLDAGLSQIMPREVAKAAGNGVAEARVFRVFSRSYLGLGIIGFLLGQLSVPWLITYWLNMGQVVNASAELALRLVLVQFLFQFANNAHTGYWNGRQTQKLANVRQCIFGAVKHAGALGLVYWWRADAISYLLPFAITSALEWWTNRRMIRREQGELANGDVSSKDFQLLAKQAGVLALAVLIGMLVSQIDRIVLSRTVDIGSFGRYVIVANLGLAFMQLQYPLMRAFFPRIVRTEATGTKSSMKQLAMAVFVLCVLPCGIIALMAPWLLQTWIGDTQITAEGTTPLRLILFAVSLNAVYNLIYQHILALGQGRLVLLINVMALVVVTPIIVIVARENGIVAGGVAWVLVSIFQLTIGATWLFSVGKRQPKLVSNN